MPVVFYCGTPPKNSFCIATSIVNPPVCNRGQISFIMKRKLDENNEAQPVTEAKIQTSSTMPSAPEPTFVDLGLDPRLVQAVALQNFERPTPVQRNAIPLALNGKDVMAKAPCGSGKTAAYVLPVLSSILSRKAVCVRRLAQSHGLELQAMLQHFDLLTKSRRLIPPSLPRP